jgi:cobalt-zinc-cadmium efflux system outer membrane protein
VFLKFVPLLFAIISLPAAASTLSLDKVLALVEKNNPEISQAQADLRMAEGEATSAYAWPAPNLSVEWMEVAAPELNLGAYGRQRFELSQSMPFFGRTLLAGRVATHAVDRQRAMARGVLEDKLMEARQAYWNLAAANTAYQAAERTMEAFHGMAGVSSSRARFGRLDRMGQMMDSMIGAQAAQMEGMLPHWRQERLKAESRLKRLMGWEQERSLPESADETGSLLETRVPTLGQLWQAVEGANPGLEEAKHHLNHAVALKTLALSGWLPDIMLEAGWEDDRLGGNADATFKAGLSLPWLWFWKQSGAVSSAQAELEHSKTALESERLKLREDAQVQLGELTSGLEELRILCNKELPKAEQAMKQGLSGFKAGSIDANQTMQAVMGYWESSERLSQSISRVGESLAELNRLTSASSAGTVKEMNHEK